MCRRWSCSGCRWSPNLWDEWWLCQGINHRLNSPKRRRLIFLAQQLNPQFAELRAWPAHNGKILGSSVIHKGGKDLLILGGSDDAITFWDVTPKHATGDSAKAYGNGIYPK